MYFTWNKIKKINICDIFLDTWFSNMVYMSNVFDIIISPTWIIFFNIVLQFYMNSRISLLIYPKNPMEFWLWLCRNYKSIEEKGIFEYSWDFKSGKCPLLWNCIYFGSLIFRYFNYSDWMRNTFLKDVFSNYCIEILLILVYSTCIQPPC